MSTPCNPEKIVAALHEQTEVITDIVREKIKESQNFVLRMIPDGGTVKRNANNSSVIYGEGRQAPVAYNSLDNSKRDLVSGGEFKARSTNGNTTAIYNNLHNDIDDNACHGQHTIDFSQGFRIRGFEDFELAVDTPVKCSRELDRLGEQHIRGYFKGMKDQFTSWGMNNFNDNLLNLTIQNGEANASVLAADQFNVTTGGWQAPPQYRITIHFLKDYRNHIMREMKFRNMEVGEDWMLEVEMPREDWREAVLKDQTVRNPTGTSYNTALYKDDVGAFKGREYGIYDGIKCYFNESPIRGYFKQNGTVGGNASYDFVRVYDWINTMGENGGVVISANHQYIKDSVVVDGVKYPMITLIPHIDPRSFKRYGLMQPIKPVGESNAGVSYEVNVIEGAYLNCNDFKDKFKLAARHEFRFKSMYPEISGYIAYRHSQLQGYVLEVTPRDYTAGLQEPSGPEVYEGTTPDGCEVAECAQCDKVPDANGQCVDPEVAEDSVLGLSPAGAVDTVFEGEAYTLKLAVTRTGDITGAASVTWTSAHVTTDDTDFLDTAGTLEWAAGDSAQKFIEIDILDTATAETDETFSVTLTAPVGATLKAGANVTTVTLKDLS